MIWPKSLIRSGLQMRGYRLQKIKDLGLEKKFLALHERVKPYTMTSIERQNALFTAIQYVAEAHIEGDIVECGVWRGGSAMLAALALIEKGCTDKRIYLYDTFTGMSEPTDKDTNIRGKTAAGKWKELQRGVVNEWDYAPLDEVRKNVLSTGYPERLLEFIAGKVEDTIPAKVPDKIALLRLDTDWYASTKHELTHLFPRLSKGGVLIIDDYGHWQGARDAVDEYFKEANIKILLNRIDYTGRIAVK